MWLGPSNQLIQIDTGKARTYFYNKSASPISIYADIGEVQVLGQRYVGAANATAANPFGSPAIYQLVKYLSTSALTLANLTTFGGPVPVYWTDNTFTIVTAITSEALALNFPSGYMVLNLIDAPTLTLAQVLGAQLLVQVAGYCKAAYGPTAGMPGVGNLIVPSAGTGTSTGVVAGTAATYNKFGTQITAVASGLCDVMVDADIF